MEMHLNSTEEKVLFKNKYRIESARLKNWDYSKAGYYYITICVKNRDCAFGQIKNSLMILSDIGMIADKYWREIPEHFPLARLDEYVIMPNHVHGIIIINNNVGDYRRDAINRVSTDGMSPDIAGGITKNKNPMLNPNCLSNIIRWYKGRAAFEINNFQNKFPFAWQPRFYDHIVRNEKDLNRIRSYIKSNPLNWGKDEEYME